MTRQTVTKEWIEKKVKSVDYIRIPDTTVTICHIVLANGFSVRGESACVSPHTFEEAVGRRIAYENAFDKIWQLEGYLLAEEIYKRVGTAPTLSVVQ